MPTYTNNSTATRSVTNASGSLVFVAPGESVETHELLTRDGWGKTADTPYFNPVKAVYDTLTATSSGTDTTSISLHADTDNLELYNNSSADVTLYLTSTSNTPGYEVPASTTRVIEGVSGKVEDIVLAFSASVSSGEVILTELGE